MKKDFPYKDYPVLFVDDEEMALTTFRGLYRRDFTVYTANSGKEAVEVLKNHPELALIVTDQRMPGVTGVELLAEALQIVPDAVRILLTAYTDMDVVVEAINTGNVYRYVNKPYNEDELRHTIVQGIERFFLIRERDRLYAEKIEALKRVSRTNRLTAIGILAAGMAHEINNPLVAISTFLQMLPEKIKEEERDSDYWDGFYNISIKETERIRVLIGQLLNYSKTAEQGDLLLKDVEVNQTIEDVVMFLSSEARKKEVRFELKLMPDLPPGKMDAEKIQQVILNLIINSIHATRNGTITLSTSMVQDDEGRDYLKVVVADTGAGISEENLHRLFNPFFTTKEAEGSGLGLMTCYHIIEEHRGSVDVRSELGKGTAVSFQIPVDPLKHERRTDERRLVV